MRREGMPSTRIWKPVRANGGGSGYRVARCGAGFRSATRAPRPCLRSGQPSVDRLLWSSVVKLYLDITSHILLTNDANAPADLADTFH
jgi:hypothetical protein